MVMEGALLCQCIELASQQEDKQLVSKLCGFMGNKSQMDGETVHKCISYACEGGKSDLILKLTSLLVNNPDTQMVGQCVHLAVTKGDMHLVNALCQCIGQSTHMDTDTIKKCIQYANEHGQIDLVGKLANIYSNTPAPAPAELAETPVVKQSASAKEPTVAPMSPTADDTEDVSLIQAHRDKRRVLVHFESRNGELMRQFFFWTSKFKVKNIINMMDAKYGLPKAAQIWTQSDVRLKDDTSLDQLKSEGDGHIHLHCYLRSPAALNSSGAQAEAGAGAGDVGSGASGGADAGGWNQTQGYRCNTCGTFNAAHVTTCSDCHVDLRPAPARPQPAPQQSAADKSKMRWTCESCTYSNNSIFKKCEMCSEPRGDAPLVPVASPGNAGNGAAPSTSGVQQRQTPNVQVAQVENPGWPCPMCTFVNQPTRPGCEACSESRPENYQVPAHVNLSDSELERMRTEPELDQLLQELEVQKKRQAEIDKTANYAALLGTEQMDLITNAEAFDCLICFDTVDVGEGVMLRECLHSFCRECLAEHIKQGQDASVKCPYKDEYSCESVLLDREIKQLVTDEVYQSYLKRGLAIAEGQEKNSFHCKTPDCEGWCIYEDDLNYFWCGKCKARNCLTCKVIHHPMNCKQYQDDLKLRAQNDNDAQATQRAMEELIQSGQAMHCPGCKIVIQKKAGCDWIMCSMCKIEICWATRGPRWGPKGQGDTSGGCKCRVNARCHRNCQNCH